MKEYVLETSLMSNSEEFDIKFESLTGLKVRRVSKSFLNSKISTISNDNGIYILESETLYYVGQSKDLQKRLKNHQDKNKINFTRCYILSHTNDIRQYLDFMEAYTIQALEEKGHLLNNKNKLNPDKDKLPNNKKVIAKELINDFLTISLSIGFRESKQVVPQSIIIPKNKNDLIEVELNGEKIQGINNTEIFLKTIQKIGLENIIKKCSNLLDSSFDLSEQKIVKPYGHIHKYKEQNKEYFIHINSSKKTLIKKLDKIKKLLGLSDLVIKLSDV